MSQARTASCGSGLTGALAHASQDGGHVSGARRLPLRSKTQTRGLGIGGGARSSKQWRMRTTLYSRLPAPGARHDLLALIAGGTGRWWVHSGAGLNRILAVKYFADPGAPDSHDPHFSNRLVRTRMPSGAVGMPPRAAPSIDQSGNTHSSVFMGRKTVVWPLLALNTRHKTAS